MAPSLPSEVAAFVLRAISRAMQHHVFAFFLPGPTAAFAHNHVLDAAIGVLLHRVVGFLLDAAVNVLLDTVIRVLRIALRVVFLVVVILAAVLLQLHACCVVAALAAIFTYLDRARASRTTKLRLAVLAFVSLFLITVAVVLMVVLYISRADVEE